METSVSVYPCVYREHITQDVIKNFLHGLSLCIQGTYLGCLRSLKSGRFIPVYTGNIGTSALDFVNSAVYPCVYREHFSFNLITLNICGLSLCIQGTSFLFYLG